MSFDRERRESGETGGESAAAGAAGKRTRTMGMDRGERSVPVQMLAGVGLNSGDADTPGNAAAIPAAQTQSWMDMAMRPDLFAAPVQRAADGEAGSHDRVHQAAAHGVGGSGGALPHLDAIQRSFGRHDVGHVSAHVGGAAAEATRAMGAQAYAVGDQVAFGAAPDLHTAAHEAAHVVQQRAGVALKGGVGETGDVYERHADAVADKVVAGESAEGLLDGMAGSGGGNAVQMLATYGGDFDADPYTPYTGGRLRGAEIEISFLPGELVVAPKIGLVQSIKATRTGAVDFQMGNATEQAERGARGNSAAQGDEGRHIDRMGEKTNPLYGMDNEAPGGALGTNATSGGGNGRFGHRSVDATGAEDVEPAWMYDRPALVWSAGTTLEQIFETTALVLEGSMAGTYLGSVEWGVRTDAAGLPTTIPLRVVSQGAPTTQFMAAAANWNAQSMFVRERVVATGPGTVASLAALAAGTVYPADTLTMTITTATGPLEVRSPIAATFDGFLVAAGAAVVAGQELAVYGNLQASTDLTTTTHTTVDPASLDDAALEARMRLLTDQIMHMDRTSPDYQNIRFEIRGLAQTAATRGTDAVDSGHTYTVRHGDTLSGIAAAHLGNAAHWTRIMALNVVDMQNPNLIYTGNVLKMPTPYHA